MKKAIVIAVVLLLAAALSTAIVLADKPEAKKVEPAKAQPAMSPEMKAAMDAMIKAATPGEHHKHLEALAGTWNAALTHWADPSAPPETAKGISENEMILGGRFLYQDYQGEAMGQPFTGIGISGYDNVSKKYSGVWIDSMGTGMFFSEGECDGAGKTSTATGSYNDPVTGKAKKIRSVMKIVDKDKHVFEMFEPGPDGKEMKTMEIVYTRKA